MSNLNSTDMKVQQIKYDELIDGLSINEINH
jgi:hypothetical protein